MDNLAKEMADKITLHQGEENLVPLATGRESSPGTDYSLSLIGRVVIDRELSVTSIRNNVLRLLRPVKGANIRILATNLFLITFNHRVDRKNALEGCPWAIDRHALLLTEIDSSLALMAHVVNSMKIVIRVHNFPGENQNEEAATSIGAHFGKVLGSLKGWGGGGGMNQVPT